LNYGLLIPLKFGWIDLLLSLCKTTHVNIIRLFHFVYRLKEKKYRHNIKIPL